MDSGKSTPRWYACQGRVGLQKLPEAKIPDTSKRKAFPRTVRLSKQVHTLSNLSLSFHDEPELRLSKSARRRLWMR